MQVGALEREAGPDALPQLREIDLNEQPASIVADPLPRDHNSSLQHFLLEAQRAQRPGRVPRQVDISAHLDAGGVSLDHLDREASTGERSGGREARDAGPDDEDS